MKRIDAIILAAGRSSRLGQAKQLVQIKGESVLRRICKNALSTSFENVIVVLGFKSTIISKELVDLELKTVVNNDWELGLSSSIIAGLNQIDSDCEAVAVLLADQYLINQEDLGNLIAFSSNHPNKMIFSDYGPAYGPPAIIPKQYFADLSEIEGDRGAALLKMKFPEKCELIPLKKGAFDLDYPDDLQDIKHLISKNS